MYFVFIEEFIKHYDLCVASIKLCAVIEDKGLALSNFTADFVWGLSSSQKLFGEGESNREAFSGLITPRLVIGLFLFADIGPGVAAVPGLL